MAPPSNVVDLREWRRECCGGMRRGRWEITTAGFDPNLQIVGADPYATPTFTGLVVPTAPTTSPQKRYLFQLARFQFNAPERAYLVGLRLYASLFGFIVLGESTSILRELEITSPFWRFPDGNISWHVMLMNKTWRARRNPANADSLIFRDAYGPALLYETPPPAYTPPNAGRPWGRPITSDLGNIHDLRYPWRDSQVELELRIPLPSRVDLGVFASVAQHDPSFMPLTLTTAQAEASTPEDRFWAAYSQVQYGRVAASLIVEEEYGTP